MSNFTDSIAHYCEGLHISPGPAACCDDCRQAYDIPDGMPTDEAQELMLDEGGFSRAQCDSCGSTYAGDRHDAHGIPHDFKPGDGSIVHLTICTDCLLFHANGDEPEEWYRTPADYREAGGLAWY
jgi:hypothetical protein